MHFVNNQKKFDKISTFHEDCEVKITFIVTVICYLLFSLCSHFHWWYGGNDEQTADVLVQTKHWPENIPVLVYFIIMQHSLKIKNTWIVSFKSVLNRAEKFVNFIKSVSASLFNILCDKMENLSKTLLLVTLGYQSKIVVSKKKKKGIWAFFFFLVEYHFYWKEWLVNNIFKQTWVLGKCFLENNK